MKLIIAFFFAALFAGSALAQTQDNHSLPPAPQTDTTSGWQLVFSNPRYIITNLRFFPEGTVYATAYNGSNLLLMRSFDQGLTWDTLSTFIAGAPVTFISPQVGFADGRQADKVIWKTTDGGNSWQSHPKNSITSGIFAFADQDTGIMLGVDEMVRTTDAGYTWKPFPSLNDIDKADGSFANSKVGYAIGGSTGIAAHPTWPEAAYCQKTTDGGASWKQIYTGGGLIGKDLYCCAVLDTAIVIAGSSGRIGHTRDGAQTWETDTVPGYFEKISFANKSHGMVVGGDGPGSNPFGIIYSTEDSGTTWQKQYFPNGPELAGVQMLNDNIAVVCGGGRIYRTTTGGAFSSVTNANYDFHLQLSPNPSNGIVTILYQLPSSQSISLRFCNIQGISIGSLNLGMQNSGIQQTNFDATSFPNGVYYCRITAGNNQQTIPFIIQK
jgi:photosystem II stability/assembly factor-like uncharacterized protein